MPPAGRSGGTSLVRASLAIHHPPPSDGVGLGGQIARVEFQFNPNQLSLTRAARWTTQPGATRESGTTPTFNEAEPATLSLEVFLDASTTPTSSTVRRQVDQLLSCCQVDPQSLSSERPSPPWVRFSWGSFTTVQFVAYVGSVGASYTMFSPTGEPLRATCSLTLTEVPQPTGRQNPSSGAVSAQRVHRVVAGDSLESLAWREYGDPTVWRAIAEANGIDDPMRLDPGRELLLPAASDIVRQASTTTTGAEGARR